MPATTKYTAVKSWLRRWFYLSTLYGEPTTTQVRLYERTSIRRPKYINNLAFLKRCRDSNLIPPGLQLQDPVCSHCSHLILRSANASLLRERIVSTRASLAVIDRSLRTTFHPEDFQKISDLTSSSRHAFITTRQKQSCKFSRLQHLDTGSCLSLFPRAFTRSKGSPISPRPSDSENWRFPVSRSNRVSSQPTGSSLSLRQPTHLRSQDAFRKHTFVNLSQPNITPTEISVLYILIC